MAFLGIPSSRPLPLQAAALILLIYAAKALYRLIGVRLMFRRLKSLGYVSSPTDTDRVNEY